MKFYIIRNYTKMLDWIGGRWSKHSAKAYTHLGHMKNALHCACAYSGTDNIGVAEYAAGEPITREVSEFIKR